MMSHFAQHRKAFSQNPEFETRAEMKDAPAFDFYPERWLVGTAMMSDAEQISYLRLLCHQWMMDGLPSTRPILRRLGCTGTGPCGVTELVLAKFPIGKDGKRRNQRLELIRAEQRKRIAQGRERAEKMNKKRRQGDVDVHVNDNVNVHVNDNVNVHVDVSPPPTTVPPTTKGGYTCVGGVRGGGSGGPGALAAVAATHTQIPKPSNAGGGKTAGAETDPLLIRLFALFSRRLTTRLSAKERKAYAEANVTSDDLADVEAYYADAHPEWEGKNYRRRNLITLLGNWTSDVTAASAWKAERETKTTQEPAYFKGVQP